MVTVGDDLPQLKFLLWSRVSAVLTEEEALALYESNPQWVDPEAMTPHERRFFDGLVARLGAGVFLG